MRHRPRHTYLDESWYLGSFRSALILVGPLGDARTRWKQPPPWSFSCTIGRSRTRFLIIPFVARKVSAAGFTAVFFPPEIDDEQIRRVVYIPDGRVRIVKGLNLHSRDFR
jgi:hypothetical protein